MHPCHRDCRAPLLRLKLGGTLELRSLPLPLPCPFAAALGRAPAFAASRFVPRGVSCASCPRAVVTYSQFQRISRRSCPVASPFGAAGPTIVGPIDTLDAINDKGATRDVYNQNNRY